jgi:hypothetical protein
MDERADDDFGYSDRSVEAGAPDVEQPWYEACADEAGTGDLR